VVDFLNFVLFDAIQIVSTDSFDDDHRIVHEVVVSEELCVSDECLNVLVFVVLMDID